MRMSNPVLNRVERVGANASGETATYKGIAGKTILFAGITFLSAAVAFILLNMYNFNYNIYIVATVVCPIVALVFGMIATFKPTAVKFAGTIYAIFQGFAVGAISCLFDAMYSGVVFAALLATFGTFFVMAVLYSTGIIRVGAFFTKFMITAVTAVLFVNIIMWVISLFSPTLRYMFYGTSMLSIIISAVMVIIASLMLLLDLKRATQIVENGMDKMYEWTVAFGLTLTLIWLYLEFLQLFAKIMARSRN